MNEIEWWKEYKKLTSDEEQLLMLERPDVKIYGDENEIKKLFFDRMKCCNLDNSWNITFDVSASKLIDGLIDNLVDDKTLLVITDFEHNTIRDKNVCHSLVIDHKNANMTEIINECKKYDKVVFYMSGIFESFFDVTPQLVFDQLKSSLIKNNIKHILILDDVKGMFLYPRDYSLFDYIIGTGHHIVGEYDLGILISKDKIVGEFVYNWGNEYIKHLDVYLKRYDKMMLFNTVMSDYYKINNPLFTNEFHMNIGNLRFSEKYIQRLDEHNILVDNRTNEHKIKMKAQYFIHPEYNIIKAVSCLDSIIDIIKQMKI